MSGQPTPRQVVVYGAVLCSCLFVLLGAPPAAAVVPPDGNPGGAPVAGGGWESPGSIDTGAESDIPDRTRGETVGVAGTASVAAANCDGESTRADSVADGTYTAVLDRIEDDLAVLEVTDDEGDTHELVVEVDDLPEAGRHPNAVFGIRVTDGELQDATYDESRSEARLEEAQERFDGLASEPQEGDEDED